MRKPGRPLNQVELDSYDVIPTNLARRVRLIPVPALPGRYDGMTLGYRIYLSKEVEQDGSSPLLAHELVHVRQWADQGRVGFSRRYLSSFVRGLGRHRRWNKAYLSIEAETEARHEASEWLRRRVQRQIGHNPE